MNNHWPVCDYHPVQCPNACGAIPQQKNLECCVAKGCPLTVIECEFQYAGCEVQLPRRNMPDHLKEGLAARISLLAVSHKQQQDEFKTLKKKHEEEIKALNEQVNELKMQTEQSRLNTMMKSIIPVEFVVKNPQHYNSVAFTIFLLPYPRLQV